ncbi:MAG: phosphatidate cytidylyltransferase [Actinomycetota bacterium]|nr:phosphatidate cytidylyltransferase [Actinomycetota bacterium]
MSDMHSINEAINKRAGRKLLPSIAVSLFLVALIWFALAYRAEIFTIVVAVALAFGIREIVRAFNLRGTYLSLYGLLIATFVISYATWRGGIAGLAVATAVALSLLLVELLTKGPEGFVASATATVFSLLYLPFLGGFLILLGRQSSGLEQVMSFVVLVGCNDTFGYFVGVLIGKHPLVPKISPKKSWEGLFGSLIFTVIGGVLACTYILSMQWWIGVVIGLIIVFSATCGDLIESAMKRGLALKDMGSLLPGHGGMLDRLDSVLICAPVFWLALELVQA